MTVLGEEDRATFDFVTSEVENVRLSDSGLTFDRDDGCWEYKRPILHVGVYRRPESASGETHTAQSQMLDAPSLPGGICLPIGTHRSASTILWGEADAELEQPVVGFTVKTGRQ